MCYTSCKTFSFHPFSYTVNGTETKSILIAKLKSHFVKKKNTKSAFELIYSEIVFQYKTNVIKKQREKLVYRIAYDLCNMKQTDL